MIILFLVLVFKLLFLAYPGVVLAAARDGLLLWWNNVLPGLLPFMIITNMAIILGFARLAGRFLSPVMGKIFGLPGSGALALIVGLTSGYPMGAKTVADLRNAKELTTKQAQHLLAFCNNAGPIFVIGVVGVSLFGSARVGYVLWFGHILAALLLGFLLKYLYNSKAVVTETSFTHTPTNPTSALGQATKNAMESIAVIGGLIIFFSAITAVLEAIGLPDHGLLGGIITGALEVTGGVRDVSNGGVSLINIAAAAFVIGFSGMSIHMQAAHFLEGTGQSLREYILAKFAHGVIAAIFTAIIWMFAA